MTTDILTRDQMMMLFDELSDYLAGVREGARIIADRHQLPPDWLNDAVKVFGVDNDPDARTVYQTDYLTVTVPSPEYLLSMKIRSGRLARDADDVRVLSGILGLRTADEILNAVKPDDRRPPLSERERRLAEEVIRQTVEGES